VEQILIVFDEKAAVTQNFTTQEGV